MGSYSGNYRQLPGMMASPNRPQALAPIPEEYEGTNFPYRGSQNHGVAPTPGVDPEEYYDHDQYDAGPENIPSLPADKEPEPVPVKIVNDSARERYPIRSFSFAVNGLTAQQFIGRNDKRKYVYVKVATGSTDNLFIGYDNGVKPVTGYLVEAGQELKIRCSEELFAISDSGDTTYLNFYVLEELAVEI